MKKIFSLVAIAAVAATMFTSCKDDDKSGAVKGVRLSLSTEQPTVAVKGTGTFTIKSSSNASEAIAITVVSSDPTKLTVDPASVTIAKGQKVITGTYTGVAEGPAKITITTTSTVATIAKGEVEVTVGGAPTGGSGIEKMVTEVSEKGDYWYAYHEDPTDPAPEGQRANLAYFDFFELTGDASIAMNLYSEKSQEMPMGVGVIKLQGDEDRKTGIFLTPVTEGTAITFSTMVTSTWGYFENLYTPEHTVLATGNDVYIAFACGNGTTTSITYRAWVKLSLGTAGDWSSFKIIEAYVCLNDGEFKVGQK